VPSTITRFGCLLALVNLPVAQMLGAQGPGTDEAQRRIATIVALSPEIEGASTHFTFRRNLDHDIIVLYRGTATPAALIEAAIALGSVRDVSGEHAEVPVTLRVQRHLLGFTVRPADLAVAEAILARLERTPPSSLPGVGDVAWTVVYLPSKAMRALRRRSRARSVSRAGARR
jgi:hypothetical protein